ncbi:1-acyl-sn-glycerol-3-phosphate acyltransferase [Sphingorhabdus soli]|uniref:1-acyl-sn-glycerol-3-phosphate acyltransferase n=1 Tax=Flavisphingopyxis soli TaxID=2601267 RepID=A0A5C6UNM8_9SPHN|nr:lysophospholipid acyltransferase family protein [Sphingorhabdus soli]TXC74210.1 1-acyl-sn-glycerol-3-phosphate acyltransferase [Sphingorhabdus soli]
MASPSIARTDVRLSVRGYARIALMAAVLLILILPHLLTKWVGLRTHIPNLYLGWTAWAAGLDVEIVGRPLRRNVLFVANHLSWFDILALGGAGRTAFVSKSEVADWPLVGWLADQNHTVYVARQNRHEVTQQADALGQALACGYPVALFPEGTTGPGDALLPFRASLLAAAAPGPDALQIQPVALDYGAQAEEFAWLDPESAGDNAKRLLSRRGRAKLVIRFLDPLDGDQICDRKSAAAAAQAAIDRALFPRRGDSAFPPSAMRL